MENDGETVVPSTEEEKSAVETPIETTQQEVLDTVVEAENPTDPAQQGVPAVTEQPQDESPLQEGEPISDKETDEAKGTIEPEKEVDEDQKDQPKDEEVPPTDTGDTSVTENNNEETDLARTDIENDQVALDENVKTADPSQPEEELALPQNEQFSSGENRDENPIEVSAEVLSRGGTPSGPVDAFEGEEVIQPGTPDKEPDERNVIFDDIAAPPRFTREELVERYHAAIQERELLNQKNNALQHKLAEYFRRKKTEESRQEVDRNVTDQEQRYMKYMSNLEELRQQESVEKESYDEQIEEMKQRKAAKQSLVEEEWKEYCQFKRSIALSSVNSRSGRPLTMKEFEIYEINEMKKEGEVSQVRLENIKLRNRLRKRELQLKQKEELAEGLHLIDFEQLKIENQTYNEKIEERNEELMKLRKKITSTVQVLTHLKEKLQFVQGENQVARHDLGLIELEVARKRDILSRTKQARDALRHDNSKLRQKCGLLGNPLLLRDYEEGADEITELSHKLDQLKRYHAELTLSISGVKKKIEQTKALTQS